MIRIGNGLSFSLKTLFRFFFSRFFFPHFCFTMCVCVCVCVCVFVVRTSMYEVRTRLLLNLLMPKSQKHTQLLGRSTLSWSTYHSTAEPN